MSKFFKLTVCLFLFATFFSCQGQTQRPGGSLTDEVGGGCDGCELMYKCTPRSIDNVDTSAGWFETGQKLLITGIVYRKDGVTPADETILYYWQTDQTGHYAPAKATGEIKTVHGHLRGWVKTGPDGRYSIYTIRPGAYPTGDSPAHIHVAVKEPHLMDVYYIDDMIFDDDPLLTKEQRQKLENRGGSGILAPKQEIGVQVAHRDIMLGLNIPNYPE